MLNLLFLLAMPAAIAATSIDELKQDCLAYPDDTFLGIYQFSVDALVAPNGKPASPELKNLYRPFSDILVTRRSVDEYFAHLPSPDGTYTDAGRKALSAWYTNDRTVDAYLYGSSIAVESEEMHYGFTKTGKFQFTISNHPSGTILYSAPLWIRGCKN
jgi:hypothetical protein